ncbi:MAG: hypothetical protein KA319_11860 [Ferruginibacter sp.]|nr:hypothetical protein [Ferruginibacter sp.]
MPSTSETGHAKNVAHFQNLISFCTSYGSAYNPSKDALKITNLQTQFTNAQNALQAVKTTQTAFNNATNSRMQAFKPLKSLGTKVINSLDATDAIPATVKDAKTINKKLQGQRATPKADAPVGDNAAPVDKTISTSQQSYDQQVEHFSKLIELLLTDSNYTPNEAELALDGLQTKLAQLKEANTAVVDTYTNFSNSLITRNSALYNPLTGLVNTALDIKKYIKSVYGALSPQYKQVSGLEFRTR